MSEVTAIAKATMVVEVQLGSYGHSWTVEGVFKQAQEEAKNALLNRLKSVSGIRVIGEPEISVITFDRKK